MHIDHCEDSLDWPLLARYFSGEVTPEERADIDRLLTGDSELRAEVASLRRVWEHAGLLPTAARVDAMWQSVASRMDSSGRQPSSEIQPADPVSGAVALQNPRRAPVTTSRRPARSMAAAGLVLAVGLSAWGSFLARDTTPAASQITRTFEANRGQTAEFVLTDGTRVVLGPESRLDVRTLEATGARELELVGEAVFHVTYDPDRPFFVHSRFAITEDLGTVFGVRAYPEDPKVQVLVLEGRVALRSEGAPLHSGTVLEEGQLGRLDAAGKVEVETPADTWAQVGWTEGRVVFRQTSLRHIAVDLSRRYGVHVMVPDAELGARKVTLDVPAGALNGVLDAVTVPLNLTYERIGDSILIDR